MRNIVVLTGLIFLLLSCERDVVIELKPHKPSLVLHAYVECGSSFEVAVGKTTSANIVTGTTDYFVENATVVLYEDGIVIDTFDYDPGRYRYTSADTAYPGKTYKVVVEAPGFTTIEAESVAPSLVPTLNVSYIKNARIDIDGGPLHDIKFKFADPATEQDYYFVEIRSFFYNSFCVYTYDPSIVEFQGALDPFESNSCIGNDEVLISDRLFNSTTKEITLSANAYAMQEVDNGAVIQRPYMKKYHITGDFYKYIRDGVNIEIGEGNPFAEPHITGGNVRNGYGLFTVFSTTTDTLR